MSVDIAHLKGWIGRTAEAEDIVTPRLVAEYRATFAPNLAPTGTDDAPPALHWCLAPPIAPMSELGPDGHPAKGGFLPPVPLPRRMWAGGEVETHAPMRAGDAVTRRSRIEDVSLKEGRSGALCFVAVRHDYLTERGLAVSERHDIVYRDAEATKLSPPPHAGGLCAAGSGDPSPEGRAESAKPNRGGDCPAGDPHPGSKLRFDSPSPAGRDRQGPRKGLQDEGGENASRQADLTWSVDASPVLLFRYSAMTFNGHRIHYDLPYVTGTEGYDGLVVHGPIQATLLLNMAATLAGRVPARFRYRGLSPLIAGETFTVSGARRPDGGVACWTTSRDGRTCMDGEASP